MKTNTLPDGRIIVHATAHPSGEPPYQFEQVVDGIADTLEAMYFQLPGEGEGLYLHHFTVRRENYKHGARHSLTGEFHHIPRK